MWRVNGWQVICAPLDCAGRDEGEARAPEALLRAGLLDAVGAPAAVRLATGVRSSVRDPASGVIGVADVVASCATVSRAVAAALRAGERPLVVGGDCALVPGIMSAAASSLGAFELAFLDGHLDALDGTTSPTGEAADMDLAVLTGRGPAALVPAGAEVPIVAPSRIVALGYRGEVEPDVAGPDGRLVTEADLVHPEVRLYESHAVSAFQPARDAAVWVHFDVDVLDASEMPAVSYPQPGGPSVETIRALLRALAGRAEVLGAHVTCFNPDLDPTGVYADRVVSLLAELA